MSFDYLSYSYFITFIHILLLLIVFVTLHFIIIHLDMVLNASLNISYIYYL